MKINKEAAAIATKTVNIILVGLVVWFLWELGFAFVKHLFGTGWSVVYLATTLPPMLWAFLYWVFKDD